MDSDQNPLFSPYWNEDFTVFPPTTLLYGEFDALRNDSEAFFEKLKAANVSVDKVILPGQSHNEIVMRKLVEVHPDPAEKIADVLLKDLQGN
jgi:acetyl esterase/lipase